MDESPTSSLVVWGYVVEECRGHLHKTVLSKISKLGMDCLLPATSCCALGSITDTPNMLLPDTNRRLLIC